MNHTTAWATFFHRWPAGMPRKGVLVTTFGEQIPFGSFAAREDLVVFQRSTPDTQGTRTLVMSFDQIAAVKQNDVVPPNIFNEAGFQGTLNAY